jgi:hypothetical protein
VVVVVLVDVVVVVVVVLELVVVVVVSDVVVVGAVVVVVVSVVEAIAARGVPALAAITDAPITMSTTAPAATPLPSQRMCGLYSGDRTRRWLATAGTKQVRLCAATTRRGATR